MPWDHCDLDFILDDEVCPRCGADKAQWSVELDKTRLLVIGRRIVTAARWAQEECRAGDEVELVATLSRRPPGPVTFELFEHDADAKHDQVEPPFAAQVVLAADGKSLEARARWRARWIDDRDDVGAAEELATRGYTSPELFFVARTGKEDASSNLLTIVGGVEVLVTIEGQCPARGAVLDLTLPDGKPLPVVADGDGRFKLERTVPGRFFAAAGPALVAPRWLGLARDPARPGAARPLARQPATREITLRDFGETLAAVHARAEDPTAGLIEARRLAARLDYDQLVALCRRWRANPTVETDNDPNRWVHPRFMLLPFMDDALLPEDAREGLFPGDGAGPVLEMCRAIALSGIPCKESAVFDDDVLAAWRAWRARGPVTTTART